MLGHRGVEVEQIGGRKIGQEKPGRTEDAGFLAGSFAERTPKKGAKQSHSSNREVLNGDGTSPAFAGSGASTGSKTLLSKCRLDGNTINCP